MENQNNDVRMREVCFWCGEPRDDPNPIQEGEEMLVKSYKMCKACSEKYAAGIKLIGVSEEPIVEGMFPIRKDENLSLYPTGTIMQVSEGYIREIIDDDEERLNAVLASRQMFMPNRILEDIIKTVRDVEANGID